jgi:hypothetical protein
LTEHRFRNAFIRNIYGEIIQLDANHNEESIGGAPRIALDLNNSNINNIHSIYIKKDSDTTVNNSTINWHNNPDNTGTIDTLVSGDGSLSFISKRTIGNSLSNLEVISNVIVANNENTKRLVKINATGDLFVKRNITAYGNLTIGKASQNTESDTISGTNINTTTIYGNFIVYPTVNNTNDYLKINTSNGNMEVSSSGTIKGAIKGGGWHTTFPTTDTSKTINSAFVVPSLTNATDLAQGVLSWRTQTSVGTPGDAYAIVNYGNNTTRLRFISEANLDSYTN